MVLKRQRRSSTAGSGVAASTPAAKVAPLSTDDAVRKARREVVHTLLFRLAYRIPKIADVLNELEEYENLELELLQQVLAQEVEGHPVTSKYRYVRSPSAMQHAPQQVIIYMDLLRMLYETLDLSSKGGPRLEDLNFLVGKGSSHTLAKFFKARVMDVINFLAKHYGAVLPDNPPAKKVKELTPIKAGMSSGSMAASSISAGKRKFASSPASARKSFRANSEKKARCEDDGLICLTPRSNVADKLSDPEVVVLEDTPRKVQATPRKSSSDKTIPLLDLHEHFLVSIQDVIALT